MGTDVPATMLPSPGEALDARLLSKALAPGRIRGIAETIDARARSDIRHAGASLRTGLREARALHSRERRLVSDALYDGFRWGAFLEDATGVDGFAGRWLGWLTLHGLPTSHLPDADRWRSSMAGTRLVSPELLAGDTLTWKVLSTALGDRAAPFIAASNQRAEVQIRANIARIDRQALATLLAKDGILTDPCRLAPHGLTVRGRANLRGHRAFARGLFEVQDEGSQLLAEMVPSAGSVLDLCAGAGGKSLAMAASGARVHALDVRARPLLELQKRARRAGLTIQTDTLSSDGALPSHIPADYNADAVLVDAPCSGSGTWRRHPELRWRLTELAQTATLQASILTRAASLVRPGGVLVYGTCSVLPAENEAQVDRFLNRHPDFRLEPLGRADLGGDVLRLAPDTHGTDGFFGARLRRT